ncbi:hypothetical protein FIU89_14480 [Roseovarius sp. THAF27]|uniref:hypothetical protein n=1 Tax=Roseovarius sp. THAF27 TaxID=2587850 RepID=UPI0012687C0D|nr:hypothetical protein [Roseovarius sp. THAF27]QFT81827.1 hypothetical protein FIU89_14480 [Roseovarius sp. THAF27]
MLTRNDGAPAATLGPQALGETWSASGGLLCPIVTGATLCDLAADWAAGRTVTMGPVAWPLLLVPYMVWAADRTGAPLSLGWQGCTITRADGKTRLDDPGADLDCAATPTVYLSTTNTRHGTVLTRLYRAAPMPQAVTILDAFAQRTYAPRNRGQPPDRRRCGPQRQRLTARKFCEFSGALRLAIRARKFAEFSQAATATPKWKA